MNTIKTILKAPIYIIIGLILLACAPIWLLLFILFGMTELLD